MVRRPSPLPAAGAVADDAVAPSASPAFARSVTRHPSRPQRRDTPLPVGAIARSAVSVLSRLHIRRLSSSLVSVAWRLRAASLAPLRARQAEQRTHHAAPRYLACRLARPGACVREVASWRRGSQGAAARPLSMWMEVARRYRVSRRPALNDDDDAGFVRTAASRARRREDSGAVEPRLPRPWRIVMGARDGAAVPPRATAYAWYY